MVNSEPVYELQKDQYLASLRDTDADNLTSLVDTIVQGMQAKNMPVGAVLAVGSSTFPDDHWERRKRYNQGEAGNFPVSEQYQDLDLKVLPEDPVDFKTYQLALQDTLREAGYENEAGIYSRMGRGLCTEYVLNKTGEFRIGTWLNIAEDTWSIETTLNNGTEIDIILGEEDKPVRTAAEKMASEREYNNAFSVLYQKTA